MDGNISNYFSKKFYTQTNEQSNELNLKKVSDIKKIQLGISTKHASYDSSSPKSPSADQREHPHEGLFQPD